MVAPPPRDAERSDGMPANIAGLGWRTGAFAIDLLTIWVVLVVLSVAFIGDALVGDPEDPAVQETLGEFVVVSWAVQALFYWVCNAIGWSPGKRVLGLRIVTSEGRPPGVMRGFARTVGMLLSFLALGLGHLWAFWDRRRQCWHDKLAGTYVVRPRS